MYTVHPSFNSDMVTCYFLNPDTKHKGLFCLREPGLELREDVDTVLTPGMILSMEPMLMIPEGQPGAGGYREHDCLVIHHDGAVENLTKFPFGPEHNIVKCN